MRIPTGVAGGRPPRRRGREAPPGAGSLQGSPQDTRCGAQPSAGTACVGAPQDARRWDAGHGHRQGAGAQAPNPESSGCISPSGPRGRFLERARPARRPRACWLPASLLEVGICGRSRRGPLDPEAAFAGTQLSFIPPAAPLSRPQTLQFLKVAKRREGVRGGGGGAERLGRTAPGPDPDLPQRCGAAPSAGADSGAASPRYLLSESLVAEGEGRRACAQVLPQLRKVRVPC